ncbi:chromosome segregation protein SMC [Acinetobacter larvae]|uniref:Chromosome partition protein Smc n=1 Tax=Acinetobacter larvae TaxID=1789224 RepID=A0A1B2LWV6_9GAMM|nr:chromosome segregation protein SMC [Acinetobacter larvae]AOA57428.1 chromosome segregation protein SMC [Acinetobacter larvae]
MRLSSLKLSGFKSFADATTLHFKANRTAVVGPNGCGKSNVIDAIRWVMGESSARQLRGGSMQDVIFTGTHKRKAVGVASVELRFENTYGKLGGAYNAYQELAVRRQVNRDGRSEYFLNGTKCRRRDITDIFLGTGLGPRSYAIIEQGMINRLVDAKPDEMRVFIEEAAGVSRYQARRRETFTHLEHTTQNLDRLQDIAGELKSQLKTLKNQSENAVRYKQLEQEIVGLKVEILSFQCERSSRLQQQYHVEMDSLGERFKLVRSEMTTLEHELSSSNDLFQRLIEQSTPLQQQWQQAEKSLAELQSKLQQKQSNVAQQQQQLSALQQQKQQSKERTQLLALRLDDLHAQLEQYQQQTHRLDAALQQDEQSVKDLQQQQQQVQQQYHEAKTLLQKQQQQQQQMQQQLQQLQKNIDRLSQQKQQLLIQSEQVKQRYCDEQSTVILTQQQDVQQQLQQLTQDHSAVQQQVTLLQTQLDQHQQQYAASKAEQQALLTEQKHLQQLMVKAAGTQQYGVQQLLDQLQLHPSAKAHAVVIEKFLAQWLSAKVHHSIADFQSDVARQVTPGKSAHGASFATLSCLADWIVAPQLSLYQQVFIAQDLTQALSLQADLTVGQSILSLDAYHLGPDWMLALNFDEDSQQAQGALSHRVRLDEIEHILAQLNPHMTLLEQQIQQLQQQQQDLQQQSKQSAQQQQVLQQQLQHYALDLAKQEAAAQAFQLQQTQLQQQLQQLDEQLEEDAMQKDDLEIDQHALELKLQQTLPHFNGLQDALDDVSTRYDDIQQQHRHTQQQREDLIKHVTERQQQIALLEKDLSFEQQQYAVASAQIEQSQQQLHGLEQDHPQLQQDYEQQAEQTAKLQATWQKWQTELNHVQSKQKELTELRHNQQLSDEELRSQLEQKRLAWQAAQSDLQHYTEQLNALEREALMGLDIDVADHQRKLEQLQKQFQKLGAVNLAASEEYQEVQQRYAELTHQIEDIEHTVLQLQEAMKSIDQETKKLFMTTFNQVNHELQHLFPKVFNGGEAQLSLEDDWQSGVKLMARPPGKRNSSLALLSGGEKALTALALVFAIFRLNPAPFCVLDEVDAPLDDANVGRFCNLVKELSEQVQFIYITHNKVAMTMATDLLGVTMPEPGASKLVRVDLEEAKEYGLVAES